MIAYWLLVIFIWLNPVLVNAIPKKQSLPVYVSIPLEYKKEFGYTVNLFLGTPPQSVKLVLDSFNEGLYYFITNNLTTKTISKQDHSSDDAFEQNGQNGFSSSLRYCCPGYMCSPFHRYECTLISQRSHDAEFFTYGVSSSELFKNTYSNKSNICQDRAEATDVAFIDATYFKNETSSTKVHIQILNSPIKLVKSTQECATKMKQPQKLVQYKVESDVQGILGLTGRWCRHPTFVEIFLGTTGSYWLTLDLDEVNPSLMLYGQEALDDKKSIVWSETPQQNLVELKGLPFFSIYSTTLCEEILGEVVSSHWGALLDLNSPCLGLPEFLWQSVMSWLPVTCPKPKGKETKPYLCNLRDDVDITRLPSLIFHLNQPTLNFSSPAANREDEDKIFFKISISLEELVIENRQICIYCLESNPGLFPPVPQTETMDTERVLNFSTLTIPDTPSVLQPTITFGTLVLQQFLIHISPFNGSIGFEQKKRKDRVILPKSESLECVPKVQCTGQQTYFPSSNTCIDPACYRWFFKRLNLQTKECEYSSYVTIIVPLTLVVCLIAELFIDFLQLREVNLAEKCF